MKSLYITWINIKQKCNNPKNPYFPNFGAKGIKMCDEWFYSFEKFCEYVGDKPNNKCSLIRLDATKNFEPDNVKWVSVKELASTRVNRIKNIPPNTSGCKRLTIYIPNDLYDKTKFTALLTHSNMSHLVRVALNEKISEIKKKHKKKVT